jgi:hypothetical protein
MELFACRRCDAPVYWYHTPALFADDYGSHAVHTQWVHLHPPAEDHAPDPVIPEG